jgi:hypothetical protein
MIPLVRATVPGLFTCLAVTTAVGGCSTGIAEADRAIFVNTCSGVTGATNPTCACAHEELQRSGGSQRVIDETIDALQAGRTPQRLTRAIARCSTR